MSWPVSILTRVTPTGLAAYYFLGFMGFTCAIGLGGLPPLIYYLWLQREKGFLIAKYELYRVAFALGIAMLAYLASSLLLLLLPAVRIMICRALPV